MKFSWRAALIILAVVIAAVAILPPAVTQPGVLVHLPDEAGQPPELPCHAHSV